MKFENHLQPMIRIEIISIKGEQKTKITNEVIKSKILFIKLTKEGR